jgi:hypothetical protein
MSGDVATPELKSLGGGAVASSTAGGHPSASRAVTRPAAASADRRSGAAPTPFYDHLMSMIDATALEDRRAAAQDDEADDAGRGGLQGWSFHPLVLCIAGLVVVAAAGRFLLASDMSREQPPLVTADAGKALAERSHAVDTTIAADAPVESDIGTPEPAGLGPVRAEAMPVAKGATTAEPPVAAKSDEPLSVVAEPAAKEPTADASLPSAIETGSVERAGDPPAARVARVLSDVNMRAGPSNGQATLATIARGRSVEVVGCRQWCEVIFAGQRGWVYKGFIGSQQDPSGH